jgi:hypothetical protein
MPNKRKAGLPNWFPLPIYRQRLTKNEWLTEIGLRAGLQTAEKNVREGKLDRFRVEGQPDEVFRSLFVERDRPRGDLADAQETDYWPIRDPTPFELFFLVENQRIPGHQEAEAWAKKLNQGGKSALAEFLASGAKKRMAEVDRQIEKEPPIDVYMDLLGKRVAVMVDLDHDDHTLELAFKIWLLGARDVLKQKARQPIGEKEFSRWAKYGLLPAFDLLFWSRITNAGFTDAFIARAIWPDNGDDSDFVDLTERFRKVTRRMVAQVFDWDFVARFWRQMELENTLDVVVARDKERKAAAAKK